MVVSQVLAVLTTGPVAAQAIDTPQGPRWPAQPASASAASAAAPARDPPAAGTTAPERPLWEAGLAVVGVQGPDYHAAASRHRRAAIAPIVVYRGQRLRVDDEGVRGRLVRAGEFELDVSGAAAFNARSSPAREGMPALDYTFELGPQALYRLNLGAGQQASAHLKARGVFSTDWRRLHARGYVVEPELRWRVRGGPGAASQWVMSLQATWASETLQDYFYQVDPGYQTASRPAYDARAGYFGSAVRAGWSQRLAPATVLSLGVSFNLHAGAANRASPLFERRTTATALAALIWTPWRGGSAGEP